MSARPPESFYIRKVRSGLGEVEAIANIPGADGDTAHLERIAGPYFSRRSAVRVARRKLKRLHRLYSKATRYYLDESGDKMIPDTYGLTKELDR